MIELISQDQLKKDFAQFVSFFKVFLLDPIHSIKKIPHLHWQSVFIFIFFINIFFGLIRALHSRSIINAILGFFITPFLAVLLISLLSLFLGYFFRFVIGKAVSYQSLSNILFAAYIPGSLFFLGSIFYPPLFVLGVVVTSALLVVGLVENLEIPKKLGIKLVVSGGVFVLVFWFIQQFLMNDLRQEVKTMDQLEEELERLNSQ